MQRFLKTSDRSILDKTFEVYKSVHEKVPAPDPKVMGVALKQLAATVPQATKPHSDLTINRYTASPRLGAINQAGNL